LFLYGAGHQVLKVKSFAKVNLALTVLGRREDGFHEIQTVFQSIDLHDELEFHPCAALKFECYNLPGVPEDDNIVWKAAQALERAVSPGQGAHIILNKRLPSGSGLGAGSGNAAAALLGLCRLWGISASGQDIQPIAATLGSDVPFFLHGGTALGIGRGEEIYPLPEFRQAHLVVICPPVHVSTAEAYRTLNLKLTSGAGANKIQRFCGQLRGGSLPLAEIFNDFETSILPAHPEIREAKAYLQKQGALAVLMSGSGSSVFGFFIDEESALAASRNAIRDSWRAFPAKTLSGAQYFQQMFG
jgi:4-diphosphocytidyl-2-C-methyl-D-erythritol kinase